MTDHDCPNVLRDGMTGLGCDVVVSTVPPLVASPFTEYFRCPHGVSFWVEPTGEQRMQWVKDGDV